MFFSPYTQLEPEPSSIDPLGFLRPSSVLTGGLFRQFTVLANHPCYQGLLCCLILYLESKGIQLGAKEYSLRFRELESFWGVLNAAAGQGVVNITKFEQMLLDKSGCSRRSVAKVGLMARPGYGTLGHYTQPSVSWGLLDRRASNLTDFGRRLGAAWAQRSGGAFLGALESWSEGMVFDPEKQKALIEAHIVDASPAPAESEVWKDIVAAYCARDPQVRSLWKQPLERDLLDQGLGNTSPTVYAGFFPAVIEHYAHDELLVARIESARQFEVLSALCQQVFEWEYVRRLDDVRGNLPSLSDTEEQLAVTLVGGCRTYLQREEKPDARQLFHQLAHLHGYDNVAAAVVTHHIDHQRAKGAGAYLDNRDVLVSGRYRPKDVLNQMDSLQNGEVATLALTSGRRRDWHFQRCRLWYDHANRGGAA